MLPLFSIKLIASYGTVMVMVCRFVVAEFDEACSISGNVIEPPPPPPPLFWVEPPQDCIPKVATARSSMNAIPCAIPARLYLWPGSSEVLAFRSFTIKIVVSSVRTLPHNQVNEGGSSRAWGPNFKLGQRCATDTEGFKETLTLKVEEPVPFAGKVTVLGLKLQLKPDGTPPQPKFTVPGTEFVDCSDRLKLAEPPTLTTADAGETEDVTPLRLKLADALSPAESPLRRTSVLLPEPPCQLA